MHAYRWHRLSSLVAACEHLFEVNARLDAYDPVVSTNRRVAAHEHLADRLFVLGKQIERECKVLTPMLLDAQLAKRKAAQVA